MTTLERVSPAFSTEPPWVDVPELSKSSSVAEMVEGACIRSLSITLK